MDIIDEKREKFGPRLQEFAALRGKSDRLLVNSPNLRINLCHIVPL